jgi:hypothetical protein
MIIPAGIIINLVVINNISSNVGQLNKCGRNEFPISKQ